MAFDALLDLDQNAELSSFLKVGNLIVVFLKVGITYLIEVLKTFITF